MYTLKEGVGGNALSISPNPPSPLIVSTSHPKDTTQEHKKRKHPHSPPTQVPKNRTHRTSISIHMQPRDPHPPRGVPPGWDSENGCLPLQLPFLFSGRGSVAAAQGVAQGRPGSWAWRGHSVTVRGGWLSVGRGGVGNISYISVSPGCVRIGCT